MFILRSRLIHIYRHIYTGHCIVTIHILHITSLLFVVCIFGRYIPVGLLLVSCCSVQICIRNKIIEFYYQYISPLKINTSGYVIKKKHWIYRTATSKWCNVRSLKHPEDVCCSFLYITLRKYELCKDCKCFENIAHHI